MISCSDRLGKKKVIQIERFPHNPLLIPDPESSWMSTRVFNCGVIQDDDGLYKMLFRATSRKDRLYSDLGLASSTNGIEWRVVQENPVLRSGFNQYSTRGIEDPRIVKWIDGWYYIFTTVLSDLKPRKPRVGIWRTRKFLEYEWIGILFGEEKRVRWPQKNAVVFPELIGNQVYLIHRIFPDLGISRSHGNIQADHWHNPRVVARADQLYQSPITGRKPYRIGVAAPPIKTPKGWLVTIYACHRERSTIASQVWSIGFMVFDLNNPTQVNYIHPAPILWPEERYEIEGGVSNVCFCCGAVDNGGEAIYVYWGGADTVIAGGRLMKEDLVGICY